MHAISIIHNNIGMAILIALASIPGRVFAFITDRQTTSCLPNRYKSENSAWDRGYDCTCSIGRDHDLSPHSHGSAPEEVGHHLNFH